jgi:hypothetical protein
MGYNPENLERPNRSETKPKKGVTEKVARKLGATAIKGIKKR